MRFFRASRFPAEPPPMAWGDSELSSHSHGARAGFQAAGNRTRPDRNPQTASLDRQPVNRWDTPWGTNRGTTAGGRAKSKSREEQLSGRSPKNRKTRRQRRKGTGTLSILYLNMHGGRREPKWEELYSILDSEGIDVACLADTPA